VYSFSTATLPESKKRICFVCWSRTSVRRCRV